MGAPRTGRTAAGPAAGAGAALAPAPTSGTDDLAVVVVPDQAEAGHDEAGQPEAAHDEAAHDQAAHDQAGHDEAEVAVPAARGERARPARHLLADRSAELLRAWCGGDPSACDELVTLLTPTLWHTARAYRVEAGVAEDVVQNAWLALARRRDQLRDPQAVLAWLLVTVRRDAARAAAAGRRDVEDPEPALLAAPDPRPGPAAQVEAGDRAHRLWGAVATLSERCQRLLRVIAFSDRPDYAALSVDLGMPVGSIGPTRGRCLKKLRQQLGEESTWATT